MEIKTLHLGLMYNYTDPISQLKSEFKSPACDSRGDGADWDQVLDVRVFDESPRKCYRCMRTVAYKSQMEELDETDS